MRILFDIHNKLRINRRGEKSRTMATYRLSLLFVLIQKVTKKSRRFEAESLLFDVFLQRTAGGKYDCVKALLQVFAACYGWLMEALAFSPGWFSHTFTSLGVEKEALGIFLLCQIVKHRSL